jgi:hypothetical protein
MKKKKLRSLLVSISLAASFALYAAAATAAQAPPVTQPASAVAAPDGESFATADARHSRHLFDQDELVALAALESAHAELQEQKAGALSPRAGGILVLLVVLILVL